MCLVSKIDFRRKKRYLFFILIFVKIKILVLLEEKTCIMSFLLVLPLFNIYFLHLPVLYLSMILLSDLPVLHISVLPMVGAGVQAFSSYVLILAAALLMFTKAF